MSESWKAMEAIIEKLLSSDNDVIRQGTDELREVIKHPHSAHVLSQILLMSKNGQVRQYAGILLKKRFSKGKYWLQMSEETRKDFKDRLLQSIMLEQEKIVRNAVTQLVGVILKYELPHNGWPQVLIFVQSLLGSADVAEQEMGMYTLDILTEIAPDAYLSHSKTLMELLTNTLSKLNNAASPLLAHVLAIMTNLTPLLEGNQEMMCYYNGLMPQVMQILQNLAKMDPEKAGKGFDLLDELCEYCPNVIVPYLKHLVELCLLMCNDPQLDEDLKSKAILFIGSLVRSRKKAIIKNKLVEPIVDMLFGQLTTKPCDESEEDFFTNDEEDTPVANAAQTLDLLALHLPPEKLVPHLFKHMEPGLQGDDIYQKKAAFLAMAILAEGCSEYIKTKYLETLLNCICQSLTHPAIIVRNAALFALGQFAEHLQPDISKFAPQLLPILFQYLAEFCKQSVDDDTKCKISVDRMFYALEVFAENLNEALLPYLQTYMNIIFQILDSNCPVHVMELALSAISSAANASKAEMLPYLEKITGILNRYLLSKPTEETLCLQIQSIDVLGMLARTIGAENFMPLTSKSLEIAMVLLKTTVDPDLKKSLYSLLASVSMVVKKDMSIILPEVFNYLISSIQSSEGIMTVGKEYDVPNYVLYEDLSDSENDEDIENTDNEDDDDEDGGGYTVDNAFVEEKEEAILALSEFAQQVEEAFLPYLEKSFEEVFKLINYPQEDIRRASVVALMHFCLNFSKIPTVEGKQAYEKALTIFLPKLSELIRLDEERVVVMESLESLSEMLKELKFEVLAINGHKEAIMNCISDVMLGRTECQDQDDGDGDDGEAEHDELLFEYAGEVLVNFGKALPPEDFTLYFKTIFPVFIKRMKNNNSESMRSYSIGTILECFTALKERGVSEFISELLPIFVKLTSDPNDEIRSNAIFGLGELALYGKEIVYPHYIELLQILSNVIGKESHAPARDNVIGAIARLIITNHSLVPLEQVFPAFVNQLPLKEDMEENKTVFQSIMVLYRNGSSILKPHLRHLFKVAVDVLQKNIDNETNTLVIEFIKSSMQDFGDEWSSFYAELPTDVATQLQQVCL